MAGCSGAGSTAADRCASLCTPATFRCDLSGESGQAAIASANATGCSGTISSATDSIPLWIHCDSSQICTEHETECYAVTLMSESFSYVIPSNDLHVTCTRNGL